MATITIGGTGGMLQGNLGSHEVNVNLDPALKFDGTNDYIDCGIRSQKSWYSSLYILIYLQIIALTVFSIIKFSVIHLAIFLCMILLQYIFC